MGVVRRIGGSAVDCSERRLTLRVTVAVCAQPVPASRISQTTVSVMRSTGCFAHTPLEAGADDSEGDYMANEPPEL